MNFKALAYSLFALVAVLVAEVQADSCADPSQAVAVYRDFNNAIGDHFYTTNNSEYIAANAGGYFAEGARFRVFPTAVASTIHLLRLYSSSVGDHFFTTNTTEANNAATSGGYVMENLAPMFVYTSQLCGSVPLYRSYSANYTDHFYTTSQTEMDQMTTYNFESIAGYVLPLASSSSSASGGSPAGTSPPGSASDNASPPAKTNAAIRMPLRVPPYISSLLVLTLAAACL